MTTSADEKYKLKRKRALDAIVKIAGGCNLTTDQLLDQLEWPLFRSMVIGDIYDRLPEDMKADDPQ